MRNNRHSRGLQARAIGARLASDELENVGRFPGDAELQLMCDNARAVVSLCDLLHVTVGGDHHDHLQDHPDPPFIWDLEEI